MGMSSHATDLAQVHIHSFIVCVEWDVKPYLVSVVLFFQSVAEALADKFELTGRAGGLGGFLINCAFFLHAVFGGPTKDPSFKLYM